LPADEDASAVTDLVEIASSRAVGPEAGVGGLASMKRAALPVPRVDDEDDDSAVRTDIVEVSSPRGANAAGAPAKGPSSSAAGPLPAHVPSSPAPLPREASRPVSNAETPPVLGTGLPSLVPPPDPDDSHDDRPVRTRILGADEALAARQSDPWPKHVVPRGTEGADAAIVRGRILGAGTTPSFEPSPTSRPAPRFGPPPSAPIDVGARAPSPPTGPTFGLPPASAPPYFGAPPAAPADPLARSQPPTSSPFFGVPPGAPADPLARSHPPMSSPFFGSPPGAPGDPLARSQPPTSSPFFGAPRTPPRAPPASWSLDDAPRWLAVVVGLVLAGVVVVVGWFVARWIAAGSL
jgi:hypothetical protein